MAIPLTSPKKQPVVLVHGFKDTSRKMQRMAAFLSREGWTVYTPTLTPSLGQAGLDELAGQLSEFIKDTLESREKFDLVGFSMGGLVCRYYLQRMGGLSRVGDSLHWARPTTEARGRASSQMLAAGRCGRGVRS